MSVLVAREPLTKGLLRIEADLRRFVVARTDLSDNPTAKTLLVYVDALTSLRATIDREAGWDVAAAREDMEVA